MASTSGVVEAATRSLLTSIRRTFIHCRSMYVNGGDPGGDGVARHSRVVHEIVRNHHPFLFAPATRTMKRRGGAGWIALAASWTESTGAAAWPLSFRVLRR